MAKVSFAKPGGAASLVEEAPQNPEVAQATAPVAAVPPITVPSTVPQVAPPAPSTPSFFNDDSLDPGDLVLPRMAVVQKVGELSNQFSPGAIVLGGQLVLADAPKGDKVGDKIKLAVLGFQPTIYVEKVEGGLKGNFYRTEQEVVAAGGTLDWNEAQATEKTLYQRSATALVLIEQPNGADGQPLDPDSFPLECEGKRYALALYTMKGTAYTNAAKHFKSARKLSPKFRTIGYRGGFWTFASQLKKFGNNFAYIPVVREAEATTETLRAAVKDLIGF